MNSSAAFPTSLAALLGALLVLSAAFYSNLLRQILRQGGKVSAQEFGLADLFLVSFFAIWFSSLIARSLRHAERTISNADLIQGTSLFFLIVLGIVGFLRYRGIKVWRQFGLPCVFAPLAFVTGMGLLLAAYPLIGLVGWLTQLTLGPDASPQEVVRFFLEAAKNSNRGSITIIILTAVFIAPVAEEFLFRGYLYGVLKRYCGILPAMALSSLLFAAVHLNLAAMPSLFVLALTFVVAYETTGSILVNMSMHALFNLGTLVTILTLRQHAI